MSTIQEHMTTPVTPPTAEEIAAFEAEMDALDAQDAAAKIEEQNALIAAMADKVLEILLMNTNIQTAATVSDVTEIVDLAVDELKVEINK